MVEVELFLIYHGGGGIFNCKVEGQLTWKEVSSLWKLRNFEFVFDHLAVIARIQKLLVPTIQPALSRVSELLFRLKIFFSRRKRYHFN